MENWLLLQTFYHGLSTNTRETMDAAAGGAFLSLTLTLWKIWRPIKVGTRNVNPTRKKEECTSSRR
jgi:type II secretory pathway component PulM